MQARSALGVRPGGPSSSRSQIGRRSGASCYACPVHVASSSSGCMTIGLARCKFPRYDDPPNDHHGLAFCLLGSVIFVPSASASGRVVHRKAAATTGQAPRGRWMSFSSATGAAAAKVGLAMASGARFVDVTPGSVPPPDPSSCPKGTSYGGTLAAWSCLAIEKDNAGTGHAVWLRIGRSGSSGFGYLHAYLDH